jgi:hypothetical protein
LHCPFFLDAAIDPLREGLAVRAQSTYLSNGGAYGVGLALKARAERSVAQHGSYGAELVSDRNQLFHFAGQAGSRIQRHCRRELDSSWNEREATIIFRGGSRPEFSGAIVAGTPLQFLGRMSGHGRCDCCRWPVRTTWLSRNVPS